MKGARCSTSSSIARPVTRSDYDVAGGARWVSLTTAVAPAGATVSKSGVVCDGSEAADKRIARVLWNDPGAGVMRHADAGYEIAKECARERG
jgi:urocanate hydratase